jgi:acyl-[acyl-carrier-protein]-phospholipid O-acyltransferase/long-chain-fatty-acid--[acyl-carrier-protein] ligase
VIPELVESDKLSRANGLINMLTNIAIILGSFAAGPLSDLYWPTESSIIQVASPVLWAPGLTMVLVALLGFAFAWFMPPLPPANPSLPIRMEFFSSYVQTFKDMSVPLMTVAFAWSGFYLVGMLALLIVPEYQAILQISFVQTSLLVASLGVSIAVGSVTVGFLSGHHIRPSFIPLGAIGMAICFTLLGTLTPSYGSVAALIFLTGFFAGFYIIPLQSLLQYLSPSDERGRFFGTANAMSFVFTSVASVLYWVLVNKFQMPPNRVHLVCAGLAAVGTVIGIVQMRKVMAKFGQNSSVVS